MMKDIAPILLVSLAALVKNVECISTDTTLAAPEDEQYYLNPLTLETTGEIEIQQFSWSDTVEYSATQDKCGSAVLLQADYRGDLSVTVHGYTCQEWRFFGGDNWPGHGLENNNHCRNPNKANDRAWCFVKDSSKLWDYCDVQDCSPNEYSEIFASTVKPATATPSTVQPVSSSPSKAKLPSPTISTASNYLDVFSSKPPSTKSTASVETESPSRVPTKAPQSSPPTVSPSLTPTSTPISVSPSSSPVATIISAAPSISLACADANPNECGCDEVKQNDYRGTLSVTKNGHTCKEWLQATIWTNQGLDNNNHCRNPNKIADKAWCWVDDSDIIWDYCEVPSCSSDLSEEETPLTYIPVQTAKTDLPTSKPSKSNVVVSELSARPTLSPTNDVSIATHFA